MCDEKTPLKIIEFEEFLFDRIKYLENGLTHYRFTREKKTESEIYTEAYLDAYKEISRKFINDIYPDRERSMRNER